MNDNDIKKAITSYVSDIAKNIAQDIADEMTETTRLAISDFYEDYDPEDLSTHNGVTYYYRHWNFDKSFKRYYSNHKPRFSGGVELLMDDLPDVYRGTNAAPKNVFWRVYSGYHGIASFQSAKGQTHIKVPIMSPSPLERIHQKYNYITKHLKDYENRAIQKIQL